MRIKARGDLLEAGQMREVERNEDVRAASRDEVRQLQLRLQEKADLDSLLEK